MGNCCAKEEPKRPGAFADTSSNSKDVGQGSHHLLSNHSALTPSPFGGMITPDGSLPGSIDPIAMTPGSSSHGQDSQAQTGSDHLQRIEQMDEKERQRQLNQFRLEQAELARRETIVTTASQSMVPVGGSQGTRAIGGGMLLNHPHHNRGVGVNTYYDPTYAAAAAQDILTSAARTGGLMFADDLATKAACNVSVMGSVPIKAPLREGGVTTSKDVMDALSRGRWDRICLGTRGGGVAGCGGEDPEYYVDDLADAFWESMVPTKTNLFAGCPAIVENLP